ncbi:hypothetical protein CISG_05587 [Coccidioides immitis RMSCC 3703]|uniref:Uncharacterized protein n=1 Tax=Coccidioides immitis RMSCC 3703 TaxID=454286 RepID=A0A0J8QTK9_COCIT|nr:hypothetical protein CISG_05587 [Coccidioides immitis RMSCC 3703]
MHADDDVMSMRVWVRLLLAGGEEEEVGCQRCLRAMIMQALSVDMMCGGRFCASTPALKKVVKPPNFLGGQMHEDNGYDRKIICDPTEGPQKVQQWETLQQTRMLFNNEEIHPP